MIKKELTDKELKKINGGVFPVVPVIVGGVLTYLGKQAFEHSDQIVKGFKKGWNKY
ncbi:class IIb bacteriocin, lactobin A/cerein 7B family [Enterococcus faecalis]|uniref:class IIb bacteriocin, lactobin A/cerein 7B family n=1 Tax=Enterococcus faecalis TaxID=1351 RepID=UPI001CE1C2C8|nr:class IIb bacteriocin, lactobin A/cerein 7B family [Enterococcus faecalis]MDR9788647.1 class IIb bacteriocin, lactobin A/cerein 7B family [Enterococcus faecalis]MEB5927576.1 class IIb bacteriocin, lactobin A/cerein 7B family [Enterococcus faecalis]